MTDRDRVIKGLEYCTTHYNCREVRSPNCPYLGLCKPIEDATGNTLMLDALALLKENETDIEALKKSYNELAEKGEPVVRCKDCKHKEGSVSPSWEAWCNRLHCGCDLDWFCADGERKEGR